MIKPGAIRLEASTVCQLKCPTCPTAEGMIKDGIGSGFLKFESFKRLLTENPYIASVELSNWGEIFLNPDLLQIMQYAHECGIALAACNGVNFNTVAPEVLEGLVRYKVRALSISIDGVSQETYGIYRRRGDFEIVMSNIRKLNAWKVKYGSLLPELTWQFVVFGHNEHEIPRAKELAQELGMKLKLKLSWDETISPIKDSLFVKAEMECDAASRSEYKAKVGTDYLQPGMCLQMWNRPQINWDGKVLGCCENYWGDFGNAFEEGLLSVLNGEKMTYARAMLVGKNPERPDIPCSSCRYYKSMQESKKWIPIESPVE